MENWKNIALNIASASLNNLGSQSVQVILNEVIRLLKDESRILNEIGENIMAIKEGPYNSGIIWISEASKEHRTHKDRVEFIKKARDKFIDAYAIEKDDEFRSAIITHQIGLCWLLLDEREDAKFWLDLSYKLCDDLSDNLSEKYRLSLLNEFLRKIPVGFGAGFLALGAALIGQREKYDEAFDNFMNKYDKTVLSRVETKVDFLRTCLNDRLSSIKVLRNFLMQEDQ